MSTLVVYDSITGEARRVANAIARASQADAEIIGEAKSGGGRMGFRRNALSGADEPEQIGAARHDPGGYDVVVLGAPALGEHVTDPVRSYIALYRDRFKEVAFFAVDDGGNSAQLFHDMEQLCGRAPLATVAVRPGQPAAAEQEQIARFAGALTRH